ncbi:MAG: proteasome assembly chaperone family protein [Nitrososphaeria archaeon]|nr:PAC2 family protein [Conexivisphaerales archaeon]
MVVHLEYYDVDVVELEPLPANLIAIEGLPDIGLVGVISSFHLVEKMHMRPVAYFKSAALPPIQSVKMGLIQEPLAAYSDGKLLVITSEVPIPAALVKNLSRTIADWFYEKRIAFAVSINGYPTQRRIEIQKPEVVSVSNSEKGLEILKEKGIKPLEEGFVAGIFAELLSLLKDRNIDAYAIIAESFPTYPDPGAAASALEALSKLLDIKIDVQELLEKADEIRLNLKDLSARTTQNKMEAIPSMYR